MAASIWSSFMTEDTRQRRFELHARHIGIQVCTSDRQPLIAACQHAGQQRFETIELIVEMCKQALDRRASRIILDEQSQGITGCLPVQRLELRRERTQHIGPAAHWRTPCQ
jgi:hypothetical protein